MRTSEEIYHRVRWDARFDPTRFVVGIDFHRHEPKRVALAAFVPGGDIPWHRVLFFEADGEVVWDRRAGIDRLDQSPAGRVRVVQRLRPPFFAPRAALRWDPSRGLWAPSEAAPPEPAPETAAPLRVLTWNTLWDRYDADRIHTAKRRPRLVDALAASGADVIALQEVERPLLRALLESAWVRAAYASSDGPDGDEVERHGVLLLCRPPVLEAATHAFGPYKAAVALTLALPDRALVVVAVHLTSDHSDGRRRDVELDALRGGISPVDGDLVVLGDFNDGGPTPGARLGLLDAWTEVRGADDDTPTFDPTANPIAAVSSLSGRASRLDRVFVRGTGLRPTEVTLLGTEPFEPGVYLSDHYGVRVELAPERARPDDEGTLDVPPTARTALAFVPPASVWPAIQALRTDHDPQVDRWPPHVNVLFGFVPESALDAALPLVAAAAREAGAFRAVLAGARAFEHERDATVWLDPAADDARPWARLREALARRFPRCSGRAEGYTPHLTLGRAPDPARVLATWAARVGRHEVEVDELVVLARRGDGPMEPRAYVSLGAGIVRAPEREDASAPMAAGVLAGARAEPAASVAQRIASALPEGAVHVTGSRRVGCALPDADLDLVAALPGPVDLDRVEARIREAFPAVEGLRRVHAARVPGVEFRALGIDVDLAIVDAGGVAPGDAVARRAELSGPAAVALSAVSDADAVRAAVAGARHAAFVALARVVKAWARAKGLDAAPFGGLPGIAWLVLCARTADAELALPAQLERFYGAWAAWDWRVGVSLDGTDVAFGTADDPLRVATPTEPVRSCTATVSRAGAATIAEELYAAWEAVAAARASGGDPVAALLAPPELHRQHAAWAVVTVEGDDRDELAAGAGAVRGKVRALLALLEAAGVADARAFPRPFEATRGRKRWAIGLGARPPAADDLAKIAARWDPGIARVSVAWAEGGAVPTLR